jgi:hypothetical protein
MKYPFLITLCFLFTNSILTAQVLPIAIVEDYGIQDVIIKNGETFYATITDIIKIDQNNNKIIIDNRSQSNACLEGQFFDQANGWIYLGWEDVEIDLGLPILLIR